QSRVLLYLGESGWNSTATDHAVRELQKRLIENGLAVVAADDRLVERHARGCGGNNPRRNALGGGFFLEVLEPGFVAPSVVAKGGRQRPTKLRAPPVPIPFFASSSPPLSESRAEICPMPRSGQARCLVNYHSSCARRLSGACGFVRSGGKVAPMALHDACKTGTPCHLTRRR